MPGTSRITAAEYLKTLDLYLELGNVDRVADRLGLVGNTVWSRLVRLGRMVTPQGGNHSIDFLTYPGHVQSLREKLEQGILPRNTTEQNRPPQVSAAERLRTLDLYLEHQSITQVAKLLGISYPNTRTRLLKLGLVLQPRGKATKTVAKLNDMDTIAQVRKQLQAGINVNYERTHVAQQESSATNLLQTLDLYLELQSAQRVANATGVGVMTVRRQLRQLGIVMPGPGPRRAGAVIEANGKKHIAAIRRQLTKQAFTEAVAALNDPI
jgi:hypothetical protein